MTNLLQQVFNGLVAGSFYALLALGLAVIFGMLKVVNFAHGVVYMLGAFGAYLLLTQGGVPFWVALPLVPLLLWGVGMVVERLLVRRLVSLDPIYNLLLTYGLALVVEGVFRVLFGVSSQPYAAPKSLSGTLDLGLFKYPAYPVFVFGVSVLTCLVVWYLLARTRVGVVVRAATERPELTRALGIDVARWITPVFGFGVGLAGFAGVLAAPTRSVNPVMGSTVIIIVFAAVVIGGMGSTFGSVVAAYAIGIIQQLGNVYVPLLSQALVFIVMALVLLVRPAGLFGREEAAL
ncbi:MAG TPA: branched-chain amino acid ABC transporter permease [Nocardioidaceae bacterium]|jgi:branched-chain amino acid transport system permease protein|nr:branched-chain amino acid ABC transporter permease [Nocardioidaceae bacterium]